MVHVHHRHAATGSRQAQDGFGRGPTTAGRLGEHQHGIDALVEKRPFDEVDWKLPEYRKRNGGPLEIVGSRKGMDLRFAELAGHAETLDPRPGSGMFDR